MKKWLFFHHHHHVHHHHHHHEPWWLWESTTWTCWEEGGICPPVEIAGSSPAVASAWATHCSYYISLFLGWEMMINTEIQIWITKIIWIVTNCSKCLNSTFIIPMTIMGSFRVKKTEEKIDPSQKLNIWHLASPLDWLMMIWAGGAWTAPPSSSRWSGWLWELSFDDQLQ